jgi:hypothetical protein
MFKVIIHIDVVEDLMFYHYPREELIANGKVPWRDFTWHFGRSDGKIEEEDFKVLSRACAPTLLPDGTIIMMRIVAEARVEQMKETGEVGGIGVNLRIVEGWHIGICLPHSRVVTTQ